MFKPINEFDDCNLNIESGLSNLLNLELELLDIEKLEQKNTETQVHPFSVIQTFKQSLSHIVKQDLKQKKNNIYKKILEEKKKILEYEIKKNNYIININSYIETDQIKELKLVPATYPNKDLKNISILNQ